MRPVVSYDDISLPPTTTEASPPRPQYSQPPPPKKRKKSNQKPSKHQSQHVQHWDDPGNADNAMSYNDIGAEDDADISAVKDEEEIEEEESRELTYEEIWDDSALINAWNAATEEYEAYHGSNKNWKQEPVNKSPLWYNIPPSPSRLNKSAPQASAGPASDKENGHEADVDSHPLDFESFVPKHDPSLALSVPPYSSVAVPDYSGYYAQEPPGEMVSQDEAFTRAMGAMYWAGYYTAIYHSHRSKRPAEDETDGQESEENPNQKQDVGNEA